MHEIQKLAFEAGGNLGLLVRRLIAELAEKQRERIRLEAEIAEKERLLARTAAARPSLPYGRQAGAAGASTGNPHRIGRNDPCPCGSGKKFKSCCMRR
jgi:uncharacterized protein YecA (UPF0149 family)